MRALPSWSGIKLPRVHPYVLLTLTSLFWAGNAVVGRAIVDRVPPIALAQIRWTLAFLLVAPFAWTGIRAEWPKISRHLPLLILLSITGVSVFNAMLYWALQHTTAINSSLMQSSAPLLIGVWGYVLFRQPLNLGQIAGVCVSLVGVAVIVSGGDLGRVARLSLNRGDVAVLIAMAVYALYASLLRKRPEISLLSFLAVTMGIGAVVLAPAVAVERLAGARFAPLTPGAVAALAYVVIFPSLLAYFFFNRGVQAIGANRAGPFFHLIPLFGSILAMVFLGERPENFHAIGAVLIIAGVILASRGSGKKRVAGSGAEP